jgi:hypothetical protein
MDAMIALFMTQVIDFSIFSRVMGITASRKSKVKSQKSKGFYFGILNFLQ